MILEKNKNLQMSMLCAIVDRDRTEVVTRAFERKKVFFGLVALGHGTASATILSYLGLGSAEKAVCLAMLSAAEARDTAAELDEQLLLSQPGHGILFITEVESGCYHKPVEFANGGDSMQTHDLVMIILNRGYSEEVMEAARSAGAAGGTLIHARGCGLDGMEKFFGMVIAPEKEMIFMVSESCVSSEIMAAVAEKTGPETDAGAVSFSVPVSDVKGVRTKGD